MISKFFRDETGLELSEYAVAAALVAIAVVGAFSALAEQSVARSTNSEPTSAPVNSHAQLDQARFAVIVS